MPHIAHWDEVRIWKRAVGGIDAAWSLLGEAVGTVGVGLRKLEIAPGRRPTPQHVHGAEEEIFYVLGGDGTLIQDDAACRVGVGDTLLHLAATAAHTLVAGASGLTVLAYGTRAPVELCHVPAARRIWAGPVAVTTDGPEDIWQLAEDAGPFAIPEIGERPGNVVALESVEPAKTERGRTRLTSRDLARAAEAGVRKGDLRKAMATLRTGLQHVEIAPGGEGYPPHCHSEEEELFVVLAGEGVCRLGDDEHPVRAGHVIARPPASRVAHAFTAGPSGLTYLAYGTRRPNDITYYPRSGKVFLRGVGVIGRIEPLDYWHGEA